MKSENVIVLGAGRSQMPVMELCRKYGKKVITVSPKGDYPGFAWADYSEYCDVRDREAVLEIARKYDICGILSEQLDEAVPTAAYVSGKMGLKGIPYETALKFRDKELMLAEAEKAGIAVPRSITITEAREAENLQDRGIAFPAVVKPADSSASRGVSLVREAGEIPGAVAEALKWAANGRVIVEEYIEGNHYSVDAYTRGGVTHNLDIGSFWMFDLPDLFITKRVCNLEASLVPEGSEDAAVLAANKKLVEAFGLPFGITHGEYIYAKRDGRVYLIEVAARGGGAFIASDIVPEATGVNMTDLYVREALGMPVELPERKAGKAAGFICYLLPEGRIRSIHGMEEVEKAPGVFRAFFDNVAPGMECGPIRNKASRRGPILVEGRDREECFRRMDAVQRLLTIEVETRQGIQGILWD